MTGLHGDEGIVEFLFGRVVQCRPGIIMKGIKATCRTANAQMRQRRERVQESARHIEMETNAK
jgi:hypothetical protein